MAQSLKGLDALLTRIGDAMDRTADRVIHSVNRTFEVIANAFNWCEDFLRRLIVLVDAFLRARIAQIGRVALKMFQLAWIVLALMYIWGAGTEFLSVGRKWHSLILNTLGWIFHILGAAFLILTAAMLLSHLTASLQSVSDTVAPAESRSKLPIGFLIGDIVLISFVGMLSLFGHYQFTSQPFALTETCLHAPVAWVYDIKHSAWLATKHKTAVQAARTAHAKPSTQTVFASPTNSKTLPPAPVVMPQAVPVAHQEVIKLISIQCEPCWVPSISPGPYGVHINMSVERLRLTDQNTILGIAVAGWGRKWGDSHLLPATGTYLVDDQGHLFKLITDKATYNLQCNDLPCRAIRPGEVYRFNLVFPKIGKVKSLVLYHPQFAKIKISLAWDEGHNITGP